jgi:predicted RNA-binding Zn-ribbon protein involved in translation (DUF1610 family)
MSDHSRPLCPHCGLTFDHLGVWTDEQGQTAIFFCPQCGTAFGAQLLKDIVHE